MDSAPDCTLTSKQVLQDPTPTAPGTRNPQPLPLAVPGSVSCPWAGWGEKTGRCCLAEMCLPFPQSNCALEEKIASLGSCNDSKLEFGSFWELIGEAAKSVTLESPVPGS